MNRFVCLSTLLVLAHPAVAQPADPAEPPASTESAEAAPAPAPAEPPAVPHAEPAAQTNAWADPALEEEGSDSLQIHGWLSQGAMLSTGNNYLAHTKRGSFEFFESGLNVTKELGSDLRAGVQIFARDLGPVGNYKPIIDWAYVDYKLRPWFGIRAGHFKMPLFLYGDQLDSDSSRTTVLMPQAVYDQHYRELLAAVSGVDIYGRVELGSAGSLDYDVYGGTLFTDLFGDEWDVENLVGSRVVWNPPVPCMRAAGYAQYANWHEKWPLDAATVDATKMAGAAPPDWDGKLTLNGNNWIIAGGGLECETERMTFSAEGSWWRSDFTFSPELRMPSTYAQLRAYAQAAFRVTDQLSTSLYISVLRDSQGGQDPSEDGNHQYDTAASVRYDVTPNFLVKAEAHAIDGYNATEANLNTGVERTARWGLFLVKTTLAF